MTDDRDPATAQLAADLAALGRGLPAPELDAATAEHIARRARPALGRGPSPRRLVEPALVALASCAYAAWAATKILEALG